MANLVLLDNSILQRRDKPSVAAALRALVRNDAVWLATCPPQAAEFCFSTREGTDAFDQHRRLLDSWVPLSSPPTVNDTLDLQRKLWAAGLFCAAGATDTLIAAWALVNDAWILHYDRAYEHLASVEPRLVQRPLVPWGSADG